MNRELSSRWCSALRHLLHISFAPAVDLECAINRRAALLGATPLGLGARQFQPVLRLVENIEWAGFKAHIGQLERELPHRQAMDATR
jgi:hypothetical protein